MVFDDSYQLTINQKYKSANIQQLSNIFQGGYCHVIEQTILI